MVLRGFSMGGAGTWHLGLKHPDRFVALGPYCGYVDTHRFSETPVPNFIKVGSLPPHQERALHMLDSVNYAANAGVVPCIAAIGDQEFCIAMRISAIGTGLPSSSVTVPRIVPPGRRRMS